MSYKTILLPLILMSVLASFSCSDDTSPTQSDTDGDGVEQEVDGDSDGDLDGESDDMELEAEEEAPGPLELTVMTYNVLCSFCDTTNYDPWDDRLAYFDDIFSRHNPDVIGTQELFSDDEVFELLEVMENYEALFFHDEEERWLVDYPDATIFYKKDRFEVLQEGYYWLSETPDEAWTGGWSDSQFWRLVGWAHFKDRVSGREFYFANTHFDNNTPNQEHSAPIAIERSAQWAETMPVVYTGDFNSKPDSEAYGILTAGIDGEGFHLTNTFDITDNWWIDSNQEPLPSYDPDSRIDHIFVGGDFSVECSEWLVDMHVYGAENRYPSDHWALVSRFVFE